MPEGNHFSIKAQDQDVEERGWPSRILEKRVLKKTEGSWDVDGLDKPPGEVPKG